MISYEFPYTGSGGKGDDWEGMVTVELTEEQAKRLDASIASEKYEYFEDDDSLEDIRKAVWQAIVADTVVSYSYDLDYLHEFGGENSTLEECAERFLDCNSVHIHYPGALDKWW